MKWTLIILIAWILYIAGPSPSSAKKTYLVTDSRGKDFLVHGVNETVSQTEDKAGGSVNVASDSSAGEVIDEETSQRFADILTGSLSLNELTRDNYEPGTDYNLQDGVGAGDNTMTTYLQHLRTFILNLGCPQGISDFSAKYSACKNMIIDVLVDPNKLAGAPKIENNKETFQQILASLFSLGNNKQIESTLLRRSAMAAFELRQDMSKVSVDIEDIFPELDTRGNNDVGRKETQGSDYAMTIELQEDTKCSVGDSDECKMNYFREDSHLHAFHFAWHTNNDQREPKEGKTDRFYYTHKIMLDRYMMERDMLGLPPIKRLDVREVRKPFKSEYTIFPGSNLLKYYCSNTKVCKMPRKSIRTIWRACKSVKRKIREKDATIQKIAKSIYGYHALGHNMLGSDCKEENNRTSSHGGIMMNSIGSARDPNFFRWHAEIEFLFKRLLAKTSYKESEVLPPKGIITEEVYVTSECGKNVLATYNELIVHDVKSTKKKHKWANTKMKSQLNHIPFEFNIRFKNELKSKEKLFIRIFLGLDKFSGNLQWFTEMDRFAFTPSGQPVETIVRPHNLSSLTNKDTDNCGWPGNLFLPRGSEEEKADPQFRLVAFIHKATSPQVNEGEENYSTILCGVKGLLNITVDERQAGFPVNRAWEGLDMNNIVHNNHSAFGNISTTVKIHHYGYGEAQCAKKNQNYRTKRLRFDNEFLNIRIVTADNKRMTVSTDHMDSGTKQVLKQEAKQQKAGAMR